MPRPARRKDRLVKRSTPPARRRWPPRPWRPPPWPPRRKPAAQTRPARAKPQARRPERDRRQALPVRRLGPGDHLQASGEPEPFRGLCAPATAAGTRPRPSSRRRSPALGATGGRRRLPPLCGRRPGGEGLDLLSGRRLLARWPRRCRSRSASPATTGPGPGRLFGRSHPGLRDPGAVAERHLPGRHRPRLLPRPEDAGAAGGRRRQADPQDRRQARLRLWAVQDPDGALRRPAGRPGPGLPAGGHPRLHRPGAERPGAGPAQARPRLQHPGRPGPRSSPRPSARSTPAGPRRPRRHPYPEAPDPRR